MKMRKISDMPISNDPRQDHANVTNARHLFGDPFGDVYGDIEDGDLYGDAEEGDLYGEPLNADSLALFKMISGDIEEGDTAAGRFLRKNRAPLTIAAAGLGTAGLSLAARALIRKRQQQVQSGLNREKVTQTLRNQVLARRYAGKVDKSKKFPFFQLSGAKMNSSPIDPVEGFPADMLKYNLDRQASDTPFYQESAIGVYSAGTWTATATGAAANRFFMPLIIQVGINQLNAAPGTVFQITASIPTINGVLTVSSTPWVFTIENKYDVRFILFPWQLVSNKALPVIGQYSNSANIVVTVTGLPSASAVTLIVPGSLHPWVIAMRNALVP